MSGLSRRLLRWVWRLYPARWRARYGAELEADVGREAEREGRLLADALITLPRAWAAELAWRRGRSGAGVVQRGLGGLDRPGGAWRGDLVQAWRAVTRAPGRAVVPVVTLALALGANAAVFSVSWAVLLRTLPYDSPERLVHVEPSAAGIGPEFGHWWIRPGFLRIPQVEAAGVYLPWGGANLVGTDGATRVSVTQVDGGFFRTLGLRAVRGRLIGPADPTEPEAVLAHALWVQDFGADLGVVGRTIDLSGHPYRVVGVAPPDAEFPAGTDVWATLPMEEDFHGSATAGQVIARLSSAAALAAATDQYRKVTEERYAEAPAHIERPEVRLMPLRHQLAGPVRAPLLVLTGAAAAVLLLGCLNLMGIEVARTLERADELGMRRALGAGAGRLFRQLALEVGLLALAGGVAAVGVGWVAGRLLVATLPGGIPGVAHAGLEPPVLLFTGVVTVIAGLLVGLAPAARAARTSAVGARAGRTTTPGRGRLAGGLVAAQVALAAVLSVGAGLLARSLAELRAVPLGYDTSSVLTFRVQLPSQIYPGPSEHGAFTARVEERLLALPGVRAVGWSSRLPLASGIGLGLRLRAAGGDEAVSGSMIQASDGFFEAMGIAFLAGGPPTPPDSPGVDLGGVVIDRGAAQRLFGDVAAVGRRVELLGRRPIPARVAGVVDDVRLQGPGREALAVVYTSTEEAWLSGPAFAVRADGDPARLAPTVRRALAEIDPALAPYEIRTTGEAVGEELAARRAVAGLSSLFGLAALVLVGLGLYGMMARSVAARRRELGIRMALGAAAARVVGDAVGRALLLVAAGLAVGLPAGWAVARLLRALLFGVSPWEPGVAAGVALVVLLVGAGAALAPAAKAGRIDPAESLRGE